MAPISAKPRYKSPAQQLVELDKKRQALKKQLKKEQSAPPKPPRIPLWSVIQGYLLENAEGTFVRFDDLLNGMIEAGHDLGKYPRRTVKQCLVSPHLRTLFELQVDNAQEWVRLRKTAANPHYVTQQRGHQQAISARRAV